ncbi:hypothetical protein [Aureliella helgolandensis]|uniref:hypothetical protein n=1 Tax=Aureliella helgolandensis TaxID=2527968 RepID=UPI0011A30EAD|nr:hypothetical protein [Aureliella helgolandensis]
MQFTYEQTNSHGSTFKGQPPTNSTTTTTQGQASTFVVNKVMLNRIPTAPFKLKYKHQSKVESEFEVYSPSNASSSIRVSRETNQRIAIVHIAANGSVAANPRTGAPMDTPCLKVRDKAEAKLLAMGRRTKTEGLW